MYLHLFQHQFHFGTTINLETEVDYVHIKIFKKTMFSSKHMSSIKIMLSPLRTSATKDGNKQQKEQRWHQVELHRAKKKSGGAGSGHGELKSEVLLTVDYRPGGEFVQGGGPSNVKHHGHVGITSGECSLKKIFFVVVGYRYVSYIYIYYPWYQVSAIFP